MSPLDHAEDLAKKARGNWRKFESFGWHEKPDDADDWTIVYTKNRDSGLMAESNAAAIERIMAPFLEGENPDACEESHGHWACGWVDGYSIRVTRPDGSLTPAFLAWSEIQASLEEYPLLDESDYSAREYEATLENIRSEGSRLFDGEEPGGWESAVFSWFWDNNQGAVENRDDQGGYPDRSEIKDALEALGLLAVEDETDGAS